MIESNSSTEVVIEGVKYLYFGGTNYLGLSHRKALWTAASAAFEKYGFSSGASRLTSGETDLMLTLERELAEFAGCEAALVLPAGFMTNLAVVDGIQESIDNFVLSQYAHGSIKSALSGRPQISDTEWRARRGASGRHAVFAEPVDPLLGTLLDVKGLLDELAANDYLVLYEAHSLGVIGDTGCGALQHFHIPMNHPRVIRTGTFSKAFGAQGGFILGSRAVIDQIKLHSYSYKVSTPVSPVACAASLASLSILRDDPDSTIRALRKNIEYTNKRLVDIGYDRFAENFVPIYYLPADPGMIKLRDELPKKGMYLPTVTSYFADFCEIGLRWTIQAGHSREQLDRLLDAIAASSPQPQR